MNNKFDVIDSKINECIAEYKYKFPAFSLREVNLEGANYIFDESSQRLIMAWAISKGKSNQDRDTPRMKNIPKGGGNDTHRGHAIAHTLGGGLDINIVPQLGSLNIGLFRCLENEAIRLPGVIYYTFWFYADSVSQKPTHVHQGIVRENCSVDERKFSNVFAG
jgi:hypothetical protein